MSILAELLTAMGKKENTGSRVQRECAKEIQEYQKVMATGSIASAASPTVGRDPRSPSAHTGELAVSPPDRGMQE